MKTHWLRSLLERWGLLNPRVIVAPKAKRKAAVRRKATPKRKPAVNHAAAVKTELLNAVAEALGRAPAEYDEKQPKATIAANGSLYTIRNTVDALSEFQSRLEKLQTAVKAPGVPRAAVTASRAIMERQRRDAEAWKIKNTTKPN